MIVKLLRQCLADPAATYPYTHILSRDLGGVVTWEDFCTRLAAWEQSLRNCEAGSVALYHRDGVEFLAALIALWRLGKQAILPANNLPEPSVALRAVTDCFAGDFPALEGVVNPHDTPHSTPAVLELPTPDVPALILYTSGSSGAPEAVPKSFAQLEAELAALERFRGVQMEGACVTGSVSHQHIYGLLFRLLWPLVSGRAFVRQERDYWEELAQDATRFAPAAIITSPAHLNRLPPNFQINTPAAVFSSGAPLSAESSTRASKQFGGAITEVYGSTETGGIAWREQISSSQWQCLPGVKVSLTETGLLQVRSPHLPTAEWFATADLAAINEAGFALLGRADRIAKIGGKRVSLTQVEALLKRSQWIQDARVIPLPAHQDRLGCVAILSPEGEGYLHDHGKKALNDGLRAGLKGVVEPIAIPRFWRYPAEFPQNAQGKVTQAALEALFDGKALVAEKALLETAARFPIMSGADIASDSLRLRLEIPDNLLYFDGHFPGNPVLPGVVQIHWAVHFARAHWGQLGEFGGLEAVKFQQLILARAQVVLELEYNAEKGKLYFCYASDDAAPTPVNFSTGRILLNSET